MPPALESPPRSGPSERGGTPTDDPADEPASARPSKDHVFELLRVSRRREVLRYLHGNGLEASLSTLAEHVAAAENDVAVEELSYSQRKRVYIALYQAHLPKLADHGVVEYDGRDPIRLCEPARWLLPYLYVELEPASLDAAPGAGAVEAEDPPGPLARLRARLRRLLPR